jgi:hypothetical protein
MVSFKVEQIFFFFKKYIYIYIMLEYSTYCDTSMHHLLINERICTLLVHE